MLSEKLKKANGYPLESIEENHFGKDRITLCLLYSHNHNYTGFVAVNSIELDNIIPSTMQLATILGLDPKNLSSCRILRHNFLILKIEDIGNLKNFLKLTKDPSELFSHIIKTYNSHNSEEDWLSEEEFSQVFVQEAFANYLQGLNGDFTITNKLQTHLENIFFVSRPDRD
jgi:hypothetical protein